MRWPWSRKTERRSAQISISDPMLMRLFGVGAANYSGVDVGEGSALGLSALWRATSLVSGTIASLPMRTLRDTGDGMRERLKSFLDDPGAVVEMTPLEWKETVVAHAFLHGDAFLAHILGGAGQVVGLAPIHPLCVSVRWKRPEEADKFEGTKVYTFTNAWGNTEECDKTKLTQVSALSLDGLRGMSLISYARNSLGTAIAGDRSAAKMFGDGALISGMLTPDEDMPKEEADLLVQQVERNIGGWENANSIVALNRRVKFTPWTFSAEDAQFIQSRQFSIEEVSRWTGVPPHLLMQTEKQTSWGQGVESQNRAMGRTVLNPWTSRFEQKLSRLLPNPRFVEFDFAGLERPDPATEIDLLIKQVDAGLLTLNEARAIRNLPPVAGGDVIRDPNAPAPAPAPEEVAP